MWSLVSTKATSQQNERLFLFSTASVQIDFDKIKTYLNNPKSKIKIQTKIKQMFSKPFFKTNKGAWYTKAIGRRGVADPSCRPWHGRVSGYATCSLGPQATGSAAPVGCSTAFKGHSLQVHVVELEWPNEIAHGYGLARGRWECISCPPLRLCPEFAGGGCIVMLRTRRCMAVQPS
jgi:hypothetical protein